MKFAPEQTLADPLMVPQAFCRLMLQISLLAIPVYLGLFMIAVPFDMDAGKLKGMAMSAPVAIFLMAAIAYAIGFFDDLTRPSAGFTRHFRQWQTPDSSSQDENDCHWIRLLGVWHYLRNATVN
ncbi:MAG: hypothetical protein F6K00_29315 [Leptolyngbya sp. SIOISBB]|nr:hypothetical protein [Leptolyngbya sp. SIOISBB]